MTPAERAAVHRLAGAFSRLSLAAELVVQAKPGPARAALVERMEAARKSALREFAAAMDALTPPTSQQQTSGAALDPRGSAAEAPGTSTTPRPPADAGAGRAVRARRAREGSVRDVALRLAAQGGRFTSSSLVEASGKSLTVCRATLGKMVACGLLVYVPPPGGRSAIARGVLGTYALPGTVGPAPELPPAAPHTWRGGGSLAAPSKPRPSMEPRPARVGEPAADEAAELARYGARRVAPEQAAKSTPRAPVTGVHLKAADFFADKPALPPARPILPRFA